jgi:hypothetical protein
MLNEQLTCAVPLNCIEHAGIAGLTEMHERSRKFSALLSPKIFFFGKDFQKPDAQVAGLKSLSHF